MKSEISFILNDKIIKSTCNPAMVLLDFIRNEGLTGTKEGCKEGDCGACTVLSGEILNDKIIYKPVNSCLVPLKNVCGNHIVTIEGLNLPEDNLTPVQQAFVEEGASQCGFCTPGFIVSLYSLILNGTLKNKEDAVDVMSGNICRCTGHNSIIRAAEKIAGSNIDINASYDTFIQHLIYERYIPEYFKNILSMLKDLNIHFITNSIIQDNSYFIGGGTDLFVQRPDELLFSENVYLMEKSGLNKIFEKDGFCFLGSMTTVNDILNSEIMNKYFKDLKYFCGLFGSTPIRNTATLGGNINNASPIGDMTAFFMALNADVILSDGLNEREIPLNKFFISYKKTKKEKKEYLKLLKFRIPENHFHFNFEKVSKRTFLDIASVNSAIYIELTDKIITKIHISAGGVSEIPKYLFNTCSFLERKEICIEFIHEAVSIAGSEISPISDARGSSEYKRLLLSRILYAHFIKIFPKIIFIADTV